MPIKLQPQATDYQTFVKTTADANNLPEDHPFRQKKGPNRLLLDLTRCEGCDDYISVEDWEKAGYTGSWLQREYARQRRLNIVTGQRFRCEFGREVCIGGHISRPNDHIINLGRFEEPAPEGYYDT